jgi:curved DNA-binding protein CbpA
MFMIDLKAESYYSCLDIEPTATAEEIRAARDRKSTEIKTRRLATTDEVLRHKLDEELTEITHKGDALARPESRVEYDRTNAHLRFFVIRPAAAPMYVEKADRLFVLDRVARRFLAKKGVDVTALCDLYRTDFAADEEPVELLDRLLA